MRMTPHVVNHYAINDAGTGIRMGRNQARTSIATAVKCWVLDRDPTDAMGLGREEVSHTHRIHYLANPALNNDNVIEWTPPGDSVALELKVVGQKRPPSKTFPWVVLADEVKVTG